MSPLTIVKENPSEKNPEVSKESKKGKLVEQRKQDNLRQILREHVDITPEVESKKGDEKGSSVSTDGLTLHVSLNDDDDLHIQEHLSFMKSQGTALNIRSRTRMENHIAKHEMQKEEKTRLFGGHAQAIRHNIDDDLSIDED